MFVSAFDDLDVMAGQGTVALEMLEDAPDLEVLPVPIGGGGLIAGMATAAKTLKPDIRIIGVEPAMYPSFTARMRGLNAPVGGQTIAEGIAVKAVGELTYAVARPLIDEVLLVEEPYLRAGRRPLLQRREDRGPRAPARRRWRRCWPIPSGSGARSAAWSSPAATSTRACWPRCSPASWCGRSGSSRCGSSATIARGCWARSPTAIGEVGGNIIEVAHNRLALDVPAKGAEFDIMIETRDAQHTQEIIDALRDAGYPPRVV